MDTNTVTVLLNVKECKIYSLYLRICLSLTTILWDLHEIFMKIIISK